jgi:prepilin-type processing-associated H-X9-DG protein
MEQGALYDQIDFSINLGDSGSGDALDALISDSNPNARAVATVVPTLLCPSDSYVENATMGTAQPAPDNYMGNLGWPPYSEGLDGEHADGLGHSGIFGAVTPSDPAPWHQTTVQMKDVSDGLSNTVAVTERRITPVDSPQTAYGQDGVFRWYCGGSAYGDFSPQVFSLICGNADQIQPSSAMYVGRAWASGWSLTGAVYMHTMPINSRNCHLDGGLLHGAATLTPSSRHTAGVNALMADGAVMFVNEDVDERVWLAAGSRNGGEAERSLDE